MWKNSKPPLCKCLAALLRTHLRFPLSWVTQAASKACAKAPPCGSLCHSVWFLCSLQSPWPPGLDSPALYESWSEGAYLSPECQILPLPVRGTGSISLDSPFGCKTARLYHGSLWAKEAFSRIHSGEVDAISRGSLAALVKLFSPTFGGVGSSRSSPCAQSRSRRVSTGPLPLCDFGRRSRQQTEPPCLVHKPSWRFSVLLNIL